LGGPTITATFPAPFATFMSGFIDFVTSNNLQCNFLSFHAKGSWSSCLNGAPVQVLHGDDPVPVVNGGPVLQNAIDAADKTASLASAAHLSPIIVINDEADMRLYFDVPFRPRMTEQFPAWLTAMMIAYDSLSSEYAPTRCRIGCDNAELQLAGYQQAPGPVGSQPTSDPSFEPTCFGQQRTIMTAASPFPAGTCPTDLLKVPVYNYELLRLLGDQHGTFLTGQNNYYPNNSDLFHTISSAATHIGSVFCVYPPNPPSGPAQTSWPLNYSIVGIAWPAINWYQFQIDGTNSNGFNTAGGPAAEPVAPFCNPGARQTAPAAVVPLPLTAPKASGIRSAQDLSVVAAHRQVSPDFNTVFTIAANTTTVFWITEYNEKDVPDAPEWDTANPFTVDATPSYGTNVVLRWKPSTDPTFYSYEVYRVASTDVESPSPSDLISPNPLATPPAVTLRAALWVDTNVGLDTTYTYWILARNASGIASGFSVGQVVPVP
jgi:hypothetical protein